MYLPKIFYHNFSLLSLNFLQVDNKSNSESGPKAEYQFTFDFGPSWYWMPDLFDKIYDRFGGRRASEFYERRLLDPAYRIFHKADVENKDTNDNTGQVLIYDNRLHGPS